MATKTILEQIMVKIKTRLETITTDNGYNIDVASVYRPVTLMGINQVPNGNYVVQLMLGDAVLNPDLKMFQGDLIGWDQTIIMSLCFRPSDSSTTPLDESLSEFAADVIKAVMADAGTITMRGKWDGLAVNTQVEDMQFREISTDGTCWIDMLFTLQYQHKENDPYNQ